MSVTWAMSHSSDQQTLADVQDSQILVLLARSWEYSLAFLAAARTVIADSVASSETA
jgi:hypothetical protein